MNRAIIAGSVILAITVLATASIVPYATAGGVNHDCVSKTSRSDTVMRCKGGIPVNGDAFSVEIMSTGNLCTGTLSEVESFDTTKDRLGTAMLNYDGFCDGILTSFFNSFRVTGKI